MIKVSNDEIKFINFFDSSEALKAKNEAETGQTEIIGNLNDFDKWIDTINEDCSDSLQGKI
ncbi:hypothetical protein [Lactobacillus jensenii]|uniref:hypothetical protein n=1 Tax=Lactobacillus jensenii TaxID=109790 RepID=UPI00119435FE|nr:hypothetical protein [Lactobacillus jensenii]MDK7308786.1 hypothetical protein [Lactobacillus jensenii]TVV22638.1 hypothetical protein FOF69_00775 [Lactobacillus jensenii]